MVDQGPSKSKTRSSILPTRSIIYETFEPAVADWVVEHFSKPEPLIGPNQFHGPHGEACEYIDIKPI